MDHYRPGSRWAKILRRACPHCGNLRTARSHRKTMEEDAVAALGILPYRCFSCGDRFYATRWMRVLGDRPWAGEPTADELKPELGDAARRLAQAARVGLLLLLASAGFSTMFLVLAGPAFK